MAKEKVESPAYLRGIETRMARRKMDKMERVSSLPKRN